MRIRAWPAALLRITSTLSILRCSPSSTPRGAPAAQARAPVTASGVVARKEPSDTPKLTLTQLDDGKSVELDEVHLLEISLPSHASTGKVWIVKRPGPRNLRFVREEFLGTPGLVGAPETQVLYFGGIAAGEEVLELIYGRPWEMDPKHPEARFKIRVRTKGPFTGKYAGATPGGNTDTSTDNSPR